MSNAEKTSKLTKDEEAELAWANHPCRNCFCFHPSYVTCLITGKSVCADTDHPHTSVSNCDVFIQDRKRLALEDVLA